jgi:hypothetical protein
MSQAGPFALVSARLDGRTEMLCDPLMRWEWEGGAVLSSEIEPRSADDAAAASGEQNDCEETAREAAAPFHSRITASLDHRDRPCPDRDCHSRRRWGAAPMARRRRLRQP